MNSRRAILIETAVGLALMAGLVLIGRHNFLLFHSLAELFSIVIAVALFVVAWNTRALTTRHYLLFIGIAYLFVAAIDAVHILAYRGMNVFPGTDANLPTQLWIAARYLQAVSLLIAPWFLKRRLDTTAAFLGCGSATVFLLLAIFVWRIFPDCFIEGQGLTPFKIASEYAISLMLGAALVLLLRLRGEFEKPVLVWIALSIAATILSELAFTFYINVYGISNLTGHLFKILAFYWIYKAMIETGLRRPFDLLFRTLKQSEKSLREERDRIQRYLDIAGVILLVLDRDRRVSLINRKGCESLGYPEGEIVGRLWHDAFIPERVRGRAIDAFFHAMERGGGEDFEESAILTRTGEERTIRWHHAALRNEAQRIVGMVSSGEDITERKRAEEVIRRLAYHDPLTGLANRILFNDRISLTLARAKREGRSFFVMMLDLDRFKEVNDSLGHHLGDELLKAVSERLSGLLREADTLARMGGDEFIILLSTVTDRDGAETVAQKIVGIFLSPFLLDGQEVFITTSVGIACYPDDGEDAETLVKRADAAMYVAKAEGRNGYRFFHTISRRDKGTGSLDLFPAERD